jgi:methyl-accepting chemotaxis protein
VEVRRVFLDNLKLTTKAMVPLALMASMFVGILVMAGASMSDVSARYGQLSLKSNPSLIALVRFNRAGLELAVNAFRMDSYHCTKGDAAQCVAMATRAQEAENAARGFIDQAIALDPAHASELGTFRSNFEKLASDFKPVIAAALLDDDSNTPILQALTERHANLGAGLALFVNKIATANAQTATDLDAAAAHDMWMMIGLGCTAVLLGVAVTAWISISKISRPLVNLGAVMRSLADGQLATEVAGQDRSDEIGAMAQTLQVFKANALKAVALEAEVAATRAAAEDVRSKFEADRAREAAEDQAAISALGQGLKALATGNLTHQVTAAVALKTQPLKDDFNAAAARLRDTMSTITAAIEGMTTGTGEISQAADDLSRRTEQQAASLEETAAALDEITATVRKTAEGANHVQTVVSTAKQDAEHSSAVVAQAVAAMSAIEGSAQQISQIIGVIDEIAFQTNLLALNAGVEAARAGEAGRGFAVVASEVRALAQRSAEAAKEIKALISTSSQQVDRGVKLVGETGESLQRIAGHVAEVYTAISDIAASAKEQASGLHEVNTAINQMDQVTQQNAAMVEQSTAASHSLSQETAELSRLTNFFQTDNRGAQAAAPSRPPPRSAKPTALKVVARTAAPRTAPAAAPTAPAASGASDSWEEF